MMKVTVEKLGPIDSGEVELGGMTVFCGGNNSGKTCMAYAAYSYHQFLHGYFSVYNYRRIAHPVIDEQMVQKLSDTGTVSVQVTLDELVEHCRTVLTKIQSEFNAELFKWYAAEPKDFHGARIGFKYAKEEVAQVITARLRSMSNLRTHQVTLSLEDGTLMLSKDADAELFTNGSSREQVKWWLAAELDKILFVPLVCRSFIVTSERLGTSLFHKDLDANRNALVEALEQPDQRKQKELAFNVAIDGTSSYAKPISHEIDFVRKLENVAKHRSEFFDDPDRNFHNAIEAMMGAKYKIDKEGVRFVASKGKRKYDIPLHQASTASRELAHLFHYLKHEAKKNDLLVIDGPESHLSSDNQAKVVRLLCDCVCAGLNVLITTHSEIIMKELNNNIMLWQIGSRKKELCQARKHYRNHAGINHEMLHAYYFDKHRIIPCEVNEWGMDIKQIDDKILDINDDAAHLMELYLKSRKDQPV